MRTFYAEPGYTESDFDALLDGGSYVQASCYRIIPVGADPLNFTSVYGGMSALSMEESPVPLDYSHGPLYFGHMGMSSSLGLKVDEQVLRVTYDPDAVILGFPVPYAFRWGVLDGSVIETVRYYAESWDSPWIGGMRVFRGNVSFCDAVSDTSADMKVKSAAVFLDTKIPNQFYQSKCAHTFGNAGCDIDRQTLSESGTAGGSSTPSVVYWSGAAESHLLGTVQFEYEGKVYTRSVQEVVVGNRLVLSYPLPFSPVGKAFGAMPGCKRTYENCGFYSNTGSFKGFPFVPVAETAF